MRHEPAFKSLFGIEVEGDVFVFKGIYSIGFSEFGIVAWANNAVVNIIL